MYYTSFVVSCGMPIGKNYNYQQNQRRLNTARKVRAKIRAHSHAASVMAILVKRQERVRSLFLVKEPVKVGYTFAVLVSLLLYLQLSLLPQSLFLVLLVIFLLKQKNLLT